MRKSLPWIVLSLSLAACGSSPDPSESAIQGVNFVGQSVSDLQRSAEFYAGAVDLQSVDFDSQQGDAAILKLAGLQASTVQTKMLKSVNAQVRYMQFGTPTNEEPVADPVPVNGPGIAHLCYQVDQETKTYHRFLDAGASPIGARDMVLNPRSHVSYAYAHDADGTIFEVEHVNVAALGLDTPPANDRRIRHISLATPDMDAAIDFYSRLLGGQKPRRAGRFFSISGDSVDKISGLPESKLKMTWFQVRNLELEIVQYMSHPTERPAQPRPINALGYNMIVFDVNSIEDARAALLDAGGTLVSEAVPMDGGKTLFGRDPDGNLLGFQRVNAGAAVSSQNFKNNGL